MPRQARSTSESNYYHIMLRGINKQNIFEDEEDYSRFYSTLFRFATENSAKICAWCLMSNHVHLLVHSISIPDRLIKTIGCSYVYYFNQKYERVGHLFQDRYRSEVVYGEAYLLKVTRYIHMNPEKAGICPMEKYVWSSYQDYARNTGQTEITDVLDLLGGQEAFCKFMREKDSCEYLENTYKLSEKDAIAIVNELLPEGIFSLQNCPKEKRNYYIKEMNKKSLTAAQICRITGLNKNTVYSVLNS